MRSRNSALSAGSLFSWGSVFSLGSALSALSIASFGSILSIASSGSILSVGSAGSILSIGSAGSILSIGATGGRYRSGRRARRPDGAALPGDGDPNAPGEGAARDDRGAGPSHRAPRAGRPGVSGAEGPLAGIIRQPAEVRCAAELAALGRARPLAPPARLAPLAAGGRDVRPAAAASRSAGRTGSRSTITPKFVGDRRLVQVAIATLASDRALMLAGEPGTAKSWLSEHLAAAISGTSQLIVQGTAGTTEEQIKYSWNYALLIAEGPSRRALVESPILRGMQRGPGRPLRGADPLRRRGPGRPDLDPLREAGRHPGAGRDGPGPARLRRDRAPPTPATGASTR